MKLLLASLALLTATSSAGTPTPPTPPGPPTGSPKVCKQEGTPLISLRHLDNIRRRSGAFAIWPSGGFSSHDKDAKTGKVSNERSQCLADADFTAVKDALDEGDVEVHASQDPLQGGVVEPHRVDGEGQGRVGRPRVQRRDRRRDDAKGDRARASPRNAKHDGDGAGRLRSRQAVK